MKKVLILGGSKGIGKACASRFAKTYSVTTVARSGDVALKGDIVDVAFRQQVLAFVDPDIMINCIGSWGNTPYAKAMHLNAGIGIELMLQYYERMRPGSHIVNISSLAGNFTMGWKNMTPERITYMASKQAMSAATTALAQSKRRDVHVTTIEPGQVHPTNFGEWVDVPAANYESFNFDSFTPYSPDDVAEVVDWVVTRPPWFGLSKIVMNNHCRQIG